LTKLKPSTQFFWAVVGDKTVLSFTTAPDASMPVPFKTMIYGDLGIDNSVQTLNLLRTLKKQQQFDMIWHVGDLNYADDHSDTKFSYEEITEGWMTNMTDIWNENPYMLLPGNHEHSCGSGTCTPGQVNFSSFRLRYNMPHDETDSATNMHYSFDYSFVHFVNVDTETYPGGPEEKGSGPFGNQTEWLIKDLTAANLNRAERPWVLVGGHRQWFSTGMGIEAQIKYFAPIFEQYKVDIVFCGHIHWYERLYALSGTGEICTKSYENPTCPIYIVTGAAGNIEGLSGYEQPLNITNVLLSEFGVGRLNVYNASHALWEFLKSSDGTVADSVLVVKDRKSLAEF